MDRPRRVPAATSRRVRARSRRRPPAASAGSAPTRSVVRKPAHCPRPWALAVTPPRARARSHRRRHAASPGSAPTRSVTRRHARRPCFSTRTSTIANGVNLVGQGGWVQTGTIATNPLMVAVPGLTYAGYLASGIGGMVSTFVTSGQDANNPFAATTGDTYAAFLVNMTATQTAGDYFFHLIGSPLSSNKFMARVFAKKSPSSMDYALGLQFQSAATNLVYTGFDYVLGTTYLVVVKYTVVPGDGQRHGPALGRPDHRGSGAGASAEHFRRNDDGCRQPHRGRNPPRDGRRRSSAPDRRNSCRDELGRCRLWRASGDGRLLLQRGLRDLLPDGLYGTRRNLPGDRNSLRSRDRGIIFNGTHREASSK